MIVKLEDIITKVGYDCDGKFLGMSDHKAVDEIKHILLDIIGSGEEEHPDKAFQTRAIARNGLREELRKAVETL